MTTDRRIVTKTDSSGDSLTHSNPSKLVGTAYGVSGLWMGPPSRRRENRICEADVVDQVVGAVY